MYRPDIPFAPVISKLWLPVASRQSLGQRVDFSDGQLNFVSPAEQLK
jgi:hypothetical protein